MTSIIKVGVVDMDVCISSHLKKSWLGLLFFKYLHISGRENHLCCHRWPRVTNYAVINGPLGPYMPFTSFVRILVTILS